MGSSTPPTTQQTTTTKLSPQQEELYNTAFPFAKMYADSPTTLFNGSGIVGLSPEERQAQQDYLTRAAPNARALADRANSTQMKLLDPSFMLDLNSNPYIMNSAQATANLVNKNLMEMQLPSIHSGSVAAGGMYSGGNTREGIAEGKAIGDTNQGLSNSIAQQLFSTYMNNQKQMQDAVNNNPNVMAQQTMPADMIAAVGAQNRSMDQAYLDEQIQKFYTGQQLPYLKAQELFQLLSGMPGSTTVSTGTGSVPPGPSPMMGGLGGAASGAALGTALMPGIGTGVGAGIGGLLGYFGGRR